MLYGLPSWVCVVGLVYGIQWSAPILRPSTMRGFLPVTQAAGNAVDSRFSRDQPNCRYPITYQQFTTAWQTSRCPNRQQLLHMGIWDEKIALPGTA